MARNGVARSDDLVHWETANAGLQANLVAAIAVSPEFERDHTLYLAGLEDGVSRSLDAGVTWGSLNAGLGAETAVFGLAVGPDTIYAATSAGVFRKRLRADDWQQADHAPARAMRAEGRHVVALGISGVLVASSDGGDSWRRLAWPADAGQARSVAVAGPSTLLVGSTRPSTSEVAVWQSTDGQSWQRVLIEHGPGTAAQPAPLTHFVDGTIFAGFGDTVMRGVPGPGAERQPNWRRASLPGLLTLLETSPAYRQDKTILAGTSAGVCISRDGGQTFQPWSVGMGHVPVIAAAFSPAYAADRLVYAVELGGRIWRQEDWR